VCNTILISETHLASINQALNDSLVSVQAILGSLVIKSQFSSKLSNDSTFLNDLSMLRNLQVVLGVGDWRTSESCNNFTDAHCDRYSYIHSLRS